MIADEFYKQILLCFVGRQFLTLSEIFSELNPVFKHTEYPLIFQIMKEMWYCTSFIDISSDGVYITESGNQALFHILGLAYENRLRVIQNVFGKRVPGEFRAFRLQKRKSSGMLPASLSNTDKYTWWFASFDNAARYLKLDYAEDAGKIMDIEINIKQMDGKTHQSPVIPVGDEFIKYQITEYRHISTEFSKLIFE